MSRSIRVSFRGWERIAPVALRRRSASTFCRGFTLIEVLLVLALLVAIGAMSLPLMTGAFERENLMNGGDVVRTVWSQARLAAMETGQPHIFRCEMKGRHFQVVSLPEFFANGGEVPTTAAAVEDDPNSLVLDFTQLPEGVVFSAGEFAPSPQLSAMSGATADPVWSAPIVFQPDGTSSDATLLLANENNYTIRVTLRGLMGTARINEIGIEAMGQ